MQLSENGSFHDLVTAFKFKSAKFTQPLPQLNVIENTVELNGYDVSLLHFICFLAMP